MDKDKSIVPVQDRTAKTGQKFWFISLIGIVVFGLNARDYDKYVIEKTNETSGRVFPVILDVEDPQFYERLEVCVKNNEKLTAIANSNNLGIVKLFQKLPLYLSNGWQFLKLYFMKPIETATMQSTVR